MPVCRQGWLVATSSLEIGESGVEGSPEGGSRLQPAQEPQKCSPKIVYSLVWLVSGVVSYHLGRVMELYAMQTRIALCNGCDNDDVKKRLTNKAQLSISAERASKTKELSRNKQYSIKWSNTREYALIDNRMVKRRWYAMRCDATERVCACVMAESRWWMEG